MARQPVSAETKAKISAALKAYHKAHPRGSKKSSTSKKVRVSQATVDELKRGTMKANIAKANSGKASAEFVEEARRFYPGKIHPPKSTKTKSSKTKKASKDKATTSKKAGPKFTTSLVMNTNGRVFSPARLNRKRQTQYKILTRRGLVRKRG